MDVVAAVGRPAFVTPDFVKPGAAVIDVGITQVTDRALVERLVSQLRPVQRLWPVNVRLAIWIALGSNLPSSFGQPEDNLREALDRMERRMHDG